MRLGRLSGENLEEALFKALGNIPAWLALIVSVLSFAYAKRSYHLAVRKEQRSLPDLYIYIRDVYRQLCDDGSPKIVFDITITNRSDSANSITDVELILTFVTHDGVQFIRRFRPLSSNQGIETGLRFDPWQTRSGECVFEVPEEGPESFRRVPEALLTITDSGGEAFEAAANVLAVRAS